MATYYSTEAAGLFSTPVVKPSSQAYGSNVKRFRASVNLATVNGGSAVTTSDAIYLARIPAGYIFDYCVLTISATLGSSVVAIGTSATHASNGQYRAAATATTTDAPAISGTTAAVGGTVLTVDTAVYLTCATANLPTSGTVIVDLYYSKP